MQRRPWANSSLLLLLLSACKPSDSAQSKSIGPEPFGNGAGSGASAIPGQAVPFNPSHTALTVDAMSDPSPTGLYVHAGDSVTIDATGSWTEWVGTVPLHGPQGELTQKNGDCPEGGLQAYISFYDWNKTKPTPYQNICLGAHTVFTAKVSGNLYLAMNDGARSDNQGQMQVVIAAPKALQAFAIALADVAKTTLPASAGPWTEVVGQFTSVTVSSQSFATNKAAIATVVQYSDKVFPVERQLVGYDPYPKKMIRYYGGINPQQEYVGLSGNPILVAGIDQVITDCANASASGNCWTWSHEMGHDYTLTMPGGTAFMYGISIEAWANLVNTYALQTLNLRDAQRWQKECLNADLQTYLSSGNVETFKNDPWLPLCFLMEFKTRFGWAFYQRFFALYQQSKGATYDGKSGDAASFGATRDLFSQAAGTDVTPIFTSYHLPTP